MYAKQMLVLAMGAACLVSNQTQAEETAPKKEKKTKAGVVKISDMPAVKPGAATLRISDFGTWQVKQTSAARADYGRVRISDANVARDVPRRPEKVANPSAVKVSDDDVAPPLPASARQRKENPFANAPKSTFTAVEKTTVVKKSEVETTVTEQLRVEEATISNPVGESPADVAISPISSPEETAPILDATITKSPVVEAPVIKAPMIEAPVIEVPKTEAVEVERTEIETPVLEPAFEEPVEKLVTEPAQQLIEMDIDTQLETEMAVEAMLKEAMEIEQQPMPTSEELAEIPLIIAAQPADLEGKSFDVKMAEETQPEDLFGSISDVVVESKPSDAKVPVDLAAIMSEKYENVYVTTDGWTEYTDRSIYWISHRPLYFEDPNLERCGLNNNGIFEPIVSAALFYSNAALLPMHMGVEPPCDMVRSKGDCPSCHKYGEECYLVSRDLCKLAKTRKGTDGFILQGWAVLGLVFLIP